METSTVNETYIGEVENQNNGGEEYMENTVELTENEVATTVFGAAGIGFGIGLSIGVAGTATTWFYQKKQREAMLVELEEAIEVITAKYKNSKTEFIVKNEGTKKEKQISIKDISVADRGELISYINKSMDKVKMKAKQKARWKAVLTGLVNAGAQVEMEERKAELRMKAEKGKVVQESIINKNAE